MEHFNEIQGSVTMLLALAISWFAIIKALANWKKEETTQKTVLAKENSLGAAAVTFLKAEIVELKKAMEGDSAKLNRIEGVITQLEFMIKFIEARMMTVHLPEHKPKE